MAVWTVEECRLAGIKSAKVKAERKAQREAEERQRELEAVEGYDPFVVELTRAIEETLDELRNAKLARDRACLARALRDLRETYHLVTGEARPGIKKHDSRIKRQAPQAEPLPAPIACGVSPAPTGSPDTTI